MIYLWFIGLLLAIAMSPKKEYWGGIYIFMSLFIISEMGISCNCIFMLSLLSRYFCTRLIRSRL